MAYPNMPKTQIRWTLYRWGQKFTTLDERKRCVQLDLQLQEAEKNVRYKTKLLKEAPLSPTRREPEADRVDSQNCGI